MIIRAKKKHSLGLKFVYLAILAILWAISGWNTKNGDLDNYISMYSYKFSADLTENLDMGFMFILSIFNDIGYTFSQFHICIYLIYLVFIGWFIYRYSKKPIVGLFVYSLLFFFRDCITLRNTLAAALLIAGLLIYTNNEIKLRRLWFALFILAASSVHVSFILFLCLLISDVRINYKWVFVGSVVFAYASHGILDDIMSLNLFADNIGFQNKYDDYMMSSSWFSPIFVSSSLLLNYIVTKRTVELRTLDDESIDDQRLKHLLNISSVLFIVIVFSSISMMVMRYFYNYFMFANVFLYNRLYCEGLRVDNKLKRVRLMYWGLVWWIFFWLVYMSNISMNIPIILNNNSL